MSDIANFSISEKPVEARQHPLAGKRVYSAVIIGLYALLINTPIGCILYGINLYSRGTKTAGWIMLTIGIAGELGLCLAALMNRPPSTRPMYLLGVLAAFCLYMFERRPVKAALEQGATLARWWPPAIFSLFGGALLLGIIDIIG